MRNLKKVLSLVLCLAMMLSIMVVGAGAAFTDQSKIKNTEAVGMCSALNIINGYTDGSYKPEGNITRAEACKMICIALNGGKEPILGTNATASFTDIKGHWAEGYIEYCVSEGIVAGVGGGKFNPNGNVTGSQFAKMLLIALGYRADHEQFVGTAWEVNVNVKATQKDLYEELETMDPSVALTRDNAAQMVWNALQANEVAYQYTLATENGQLVSKVTVDDKLVGNATITLLKDKYGATTEFVRLVDVEYDADKDEYTYSYIELTDDYAFASNVKTITSDEDYSNLFLNNVTIVLDKNKDLMGMYSEDTTILVTSTVDNIKASSVSDNDKKITIDGTEYKLNTSEDSISFIQYMTADDQHKTTYAGVSGNPAWTIELFDGNDDGKGDFFVVYPFSVAEVTYVGTKSITAGGTAYTFEDNDIYDGVAKDDYAVIVKGVNTVANTDVANEDAVITKADITTATVEGVRTGEVKLDGVWYTETVSNTLNVNDTYDFVIINDVVLAAEVVEEGSDNILYVSAVDKADTTFDSDDVTYDVKAYFADGTAAQVITVSEVEGKDCTVGSATVAAIAPVAKTLYTYEKNGDTYELKAVAEKTNDAGYDHFKSYSAGFDADSEKLAGMRVADDAVIFVHDKDGVEVISGKALKDWNSDFGDRTDILYSESNGINYVKVGLIISSQASSPASLSDIQYGYVTSNTWSTTIKDDDKDVNVTAIEIWNGSQDVTLYTKETVSLKDGDTIAYKIDGLYAVNVQKDGTLVAITGFDYEAEGDLVYNDGVNKNVNVVLDEDVVLIGIDTKNTAGSEAIDLNGIQLAQSKNDGQVTPNAYIIVKSENSKNLVKAIFMDCNNDVDGATAFAK